MIVPISELEKGNGELYMVYGNLNITMVYLSFSCICYSQWNFCKIEDGKYEGFVNVDVLNSSSYLSHWCSCCLGKMTASIVNVEF